MLDAKTIKSGWSSAATAIAILLVLTLVLYQQTVLYLVSIWNQLTIGEYAHGYLVLAISLYLILHNRKRLARSTPCPSYAVLPLVFLSALLWLAAVIVDVEMLQALALLALVFTVTWTMTGHQVMKILAFPVLFIGFAIPVWFPLSPLLQNITADAVFWAMRLIEVPAYRQENLITVPAGVFSIEEACSGLRYLLAALTLGTLYGYLNYATIRGRVAVVLVAAVTAVLSNFVRVFIVVYLGYATDMQHPWVQDHLMLGWYLFGGLVAILLFIDARYYRHGAKDEHSTDSGPHSTASCQKGLSQYVMITVFCVTLIAMAPAIVYQQNNQRPLSQADISVTLPEVAGWSHQQGSENDWLPLYHGAITAKSDYLARGGNVTLFIAYYPEQQQGKELINDLNRISNNKIWRTKYAHAAVRRLPAHEVMEQVIVNKHNQKRLIWYWYTIGGQATTNKYEAKLLQLKSMLKGQPQSYLAAVSVEVNDDLQSSRQRLGEIINDLKSPLANLQVTGKNNE